MNYPDIFRHIQSPIQPWHISRGISRTLTYSAPEAYSEPWHIQNPGLFRAPVYSELWHIQNPRLIRNPVKHLRLAFCKNS